MYTDPGSHLLVPAVHEHGHSLREKSLKFQVPLTLRPSVRIRRTVWDISLLEMTAVISVESWLVKGEPLKSPWFIWSMF